MSLLDVLWKHSCGGMMSADHVRARFYFKNPDIILIILPYRDISWMAYAEITLFTNKKARIEFDIYDNIEYVLIAM